MTIPSAAKLSPFRRIGPYVEALRALAEQRKLDTEWAERCHAALNGEASQKLRSSVALKTRRRYGAFFTGSTLSASLLEHVTPKGDDPVYYDPTCGMGDLLLAAASKLPMGNTLQSTLDAWGNQLWGTDLHQEFVDAAKLRLLLLARQRHGDSGGKFNPRVDHFPNIAVGDALRSFVEYEQATHVLMNPPFGSVKVGKELSWTSGSITAAAIFVADALKKVSPGVQILAVLPEVLRAGTFSRKWRETISQGAEVKLVVPHGVFDQSADIDVFLLSAIRRFEIGVDAMAWPAPTQSKATVLGDLFSVSVGRVVPHRDPKAGTKLPYIHPRTVEPWSKVSQFPETRRHRFPGYNGPFVVIRRTSRFEQPYRAIASVISSSEPVHVENHLIVCQPHDKSLASCVRLMKQLKTEEVNLYLNERIRCRHLTVSAVTAIPIAW